MAVLSISDNAETTMINIMFDCSTHSAEKLM